MITSSDLQCLDCAKLFRVSALGMRIKHVVCPECGSKKIDYMTEKQEEKFEEYI